MQAAMTPQQRREAKQEILEQIKQGTEVEQARSASRVPIHRATLYRLREAECRTTKKEP